MFKQKFNRIVQSLLRPKLLQILGIAFAVLVSVSTLGNFANATPNANSIDLALKNPTLKTVVASPHRSQKNRARDRDRHPIETLEFFGIRPNQTVVELWAGNGWYTEILAPFLRDRGQLIVTNSDPNTDKYAKVLQEKLASNPAIFGKVKVVTIAPPKNLTLAPDNSVDLVLTFRNIHNWVLAGYDQKVYEAAFKALKPKGIFGVEEHRAQVGTSAKESAKTGYIAEDAAIAAIEKVGFKLVGKSEINANPKDTKDYVAGVWTLPPTLRQGEKDKERYLAIGESDRMTLKFIKP